MKNYISRRFGRMAGIILPAAFLTFVAPTYANRLTDTPTQKGIKTAYEHFWPGNFNEDGTFGTFNNGQYYQIDFTAYQSQGGAAGTQHPLPGVNGMLARGDMIPLTQEELGALDAAIVRYLELAGIDSTTAHWTTLNWLSEELPTSGVPDDEPQSRKSTWGRVKSLYRE